MPSRAAQQAPTTSPSLQSVRDRIDRIDDRILDLIEERLGLCTDIAGQKDADDRLLKLRPAREKHVLGRLTARARRTPPALVAQVWRGLMAHGLQAQVRTEFVLCATGDAAGLCEQVDRRFGPGAAIRVVATPAEALDAARGREAVAVIEQGLDFALDAGLVRFETLADARGQCRAVAIGRVAPEDAIAQGVR